jgi:glycerol-3-phosphate dehydrogenase (NAD(P)+)
MNISIIGYGSWGQALSYVCSNHFKNIYVWHYREINPRQKNVITTDSWKQIYSSPYILYALPTSYMEDILSKGRNATQDKSVFINSSKGLSRLGMKMPYHIFNESGLPLSYMSLSGPSFSNGILHGDPTALNVAVDDKTIFDTFSSYFTQSNLKLFYSKDVIGTEWGGIFKNIVSILVGIVDGLGYGVNTRALFITKGLLEMCKTGELLGAKKDTFYTFSGIGDIVLSTSDLDGRNYSFGLSIGRGNRSDTSLREVKGTIEGYHTLVTLKKENHIFLHEPLLSLLDDIFFKEKDPKEVFSDYLASL